MVKAILDTFLGITWETLVILALVLANGFFVAAEFALVKVRASQLQPMAKMGGWRVRFALKATEHLDAVLSATQLGITLASLALGWLGRPFVAHRLEPILNAFGVTDPRAVVSISIAVAFGLITFLHIVLGELAPKSLAIQRAKTVSLWTAAPLMLFYYLLFPFIWILNGTANLLLRVAGLRPVEEGTQDFSADELEYVFSRARHVAPADVLINRLMVQTLRVRATCAEQIMIPREEVVALWLDKPMSENLRVAQMSGMSRFPVCIGNMDEVRGVLLVREWLWQMQALGEEVSFAPLIRPVLKFELKTPVPLMIEKFRVARSHLAVVLDEQKKLAGLVTFEDVLEEIVGDIRDELDIGSGPVFESSAQAIVVDGEMTLRELQAETGWAIEGDGDESVSEWMAMALARAPRRNNSVMIGELRVTAYAVSAGRVRRVRVERVTQEEQERATQEEQERAEEEKERSEREDEGKA